MRNTNRVIVNFVASCILLLIAFSTLGSASAQWDFNPCPPICIEDISIPGVQPVTNNDSQLSGPGGAAVMAASTDYLTIVNERSYNIWIAVIARGRYDSRWSLQSEEGWYASGWYLVEAFEEISIRFEGTSSDSIYIYAYQDNIYPFRHLLNRYNSDGVERDGAEYIVTYGVVFKDNAEDQISECDWLDDCNPDRDIEFVWFRELNTNFTATYGSQEYTFTFRR